MPNIEAEHVICHIFNIITSNFTSEILTYRQSYLTLCTIKIIRAYVQFHIFVPNIEAEHVSCHVFNIITSNFASEVLTYRQSHLTLCTIKITTCFCSASYFRAQHWSQTCYLPYLQHYYIKFYYKANFPFVTSSTWIIATAYIHASFSISRVLFWTLSNISDGTFCENS